MEITFVLPNPGISGGTRAIFEISNQLIRRGNKVRIVFCTISPWDEMGLNFKSIEGLRHFFYFGRSFITDPQIKKTFPLFAEQIRISRLRSKNIPDSEILIATSWPTSEEVYKSPCCKGDKYYFIQGFETWSGPPERVISTYRLPLKRITVSTLLKKILQQEIGVDSKGPVTLGVNFQQFNRLNRVKYGANRIGMLYHPHPLKGVKKGLEAFEIAKKKYCDINLVMFGNVKHPIGLPKEVEYHFNVPQESLKYIYSSCSIWMIPSLTEGCCMIPMEAMACGCAVVSTKIGGIDDYSIPGDTALICDPGDVDGLASNLIALLGDNKLRQRIAEGGFRYIQQFTWEKTADNFLECLGK